MRRCRSRLTLTVLSLLAASSTRCSFIGTAVGASADRHHERVVNILGGVQDVDGRNEGTRVELLLRDGRKLRGSCRGLESNGGRTTGLRIEQSGKTLVVPSEDVVAVGRVETPNKYKTMGLAIGALVDAAVIASWANHWRNYDK